MDSDRASRTGEVSVAPEELAAALRRQPFVPFRITLNEGSVYDIRHPELCMTGRRSAVIGVEAHDDPDHFFERSVTVDLLHIARLQSIEPAPRGDNGST
jgi:hypothetical protein